MPDRISRSSQPVNAPTASTASRYTVRSGDTLSAIAARAGTTVAALVEANRARYPTLATNPGAIQIGWQLEVPAGRPGAPTPPPAPTRQRSNNDVLLVGMNETSKYEAQVLRNRGVNVTHVMDSAENDKVKVTVNGRTTTYDLSTEQGARDFALTLRLPVEQTEKVAQAIRSAGEDAKDELAQLAQVWAKAERGEGMPSRFVLSGHNTGGGPWGDDNGQLSFTALGKLAEAMPRAARTVEDLHLAACYSGGQPAMEKYRAMFPNVKTIFAYAGSAPGTYSGAEGHLTRWERATRGDVATLQRAIVEGTRKGENVAVWSARHGYVDGNPPTALERVRSDYDTAAQQYEQFFSGTRAVDNPQQGPLRDCYNRLQRLLQHPELPASERPALEARRDQTIRLLFYSTNIAPRFAQHYGPGIARGFESVGLTPPNFATLTRAQALEQIRAFEQKLQETSPQPRAAVELLPILTEGLRNLDRRRIPDGWV